MCEPTKGLTDALPQSALQHAKRECGREPKKFKISSELDDVILLSLLPARHRREYFHSSFDHCACDFCSSSAVDRELVYCLLLRSLLSADGSGSAMSDSLCTTLLGRH